MKEYWIKANRRGNYSLMERDKETGKTKVISHADTLDAAKVQLRAQKPKEERQYADRNLDLFSRWWKKDYSRRKLAKKSISSMRSNMDRLLLNLGSLEIENSSIEDLQAKVDKMSDQPRMAMCINILLKFAGRYESKGRKGREGEFVHSERQSLSEVEFIRIDQLKAIDWTKVYRKGSRRRKSNYHELLKIAAFTAFGTGARFGEMFQIKRAGSTVWIGSQLYEDLTIGLPKRGKGRNVPVISECRPYVEQWVAFPREIKEKFRTTQVAKDMRRLMGIRWHSLRHSYAIHLLEIGRFSLEDTAKALGNSITVCQDYYSDYVLDEIAAERLAKKV